MTVSEFTQSGDNQYNTRKWKTSETCTYTTLIHMGYVILTRTAVHASSG